MDGREMLAFHKAPTTTNISDGIVAAISYLLREQSDRSPQFRGADAISAVMIGTTQFTNAFVERRRLLPVGVLRIALPAARGVPPMAGWPEDFSQALGAHHYMATGGYQFDGRLNASLDEKAVAAAARDMRTKRLKAAAICGLFSPLNSEMEERAATIFAQEAPDISVTLSNKIGRIGLLERENAAIMNASLAKLAIDVVKAFRDALKSLGILAPFFISQNDGTLMSADHVAKYPVLTFASGPTNSMRGAAYLSKAEGALVADIGGTTTDIGVLAEGFPRESALAVDIGGVRTNFRMPDLLSVGLGGGSLVRTDGPVRVGPQSVGYRLAQDARVFGGETLTATDIAVAAGYADIGDKSRVADLSSAFVKEAVAKIHEIFAEAVDRMKTSSAPIPLILVGGGSVLIDRKIPGVSELIVPPAAAVANAIGASIAQVGGDVDRVFSFEKLGRENAIQVAIEEARAGATEAGADPDTLRVIEVEELPLAYLPGGAVRLRVKVAGDLRLESDPARHKTVSA
jgi:N-methylhydantoinase A/oxoprolinase/acetone carboxylase beta subunit